MDKFGSESSAGFAGRTKDLFVGLVFLLSVGGLILSFVDNPILNGTS
jgi:hypothetical protein